MRLLLDSHALIWAVDDPDRLGRAAKQELSDPANDRLVSAASVWEIAIKGGLGKLKLSLPFRQWIDGAVKDTVATLFPIEIEHADASLRLANYHGDPFDRMLAAQSLAANLTIISIDEKFDRYGVQRIWA